LNQLSYANIPYVLSERSFSYVKNKCDADQLASFRIVWLLLPTGSDAPQFSKPFIP